MSRDVTPIEDDIEELLRAILRPAAGGRGSLVRREVAEWDSLRHVEIVFALEDRYGVVFDESEFAALDSSRSIVALLRARLAA